MTLHIIKIFTHCSPRCAGTHTHPYPLAVAAAVFCHSVVAYKLVRVSAVLRLTDTRHDTLRFSLCYRSSSLPLPLFLLLLLWIARKIDSTSSSPLLLLLGRFVAPALSLFLSFGHSRIIFGFGCCFFPCFGGRTDDESPVCSAGCTLFVIIFAFCSTVSIFSNTFPQVAARKQSFRFHHRRLQVRIDSLFGWCCSMKFFLCLETKPDSAPHTTDVVCLWSAFETTESFSEPLNLYSSTRLSSCNRSH